MKKKDTLPLTMLFDYELESSRANNEELALEEQSFMEEYSKAYSSCTHVFYNILYPVRFELMSENFYTGDEESPCLKWFNNKCSYKHIIDAKTLEYAIKDAISMVKSDAEKDIQHAKQVEVWKERLKEVNENLNKVNKKLNEHKKYKLLKKKRSLLFERSYLQSKIHQKFSSKRIFGSKRLMLEINNAYSSALKKKSRDNNYKLSETYLTDKERAEIEEYKKNKQKEFRAKKYGIYKVQGDASYYGCRYFMLTDNHHLIIFKPNRNTRIKLWIDDLRGYDELLAKIYELSKNKKISLAFTLNTLDHTIAISYDAKTVYGNDFKIRNLTKFRFCGIDLNPDEVGYAIVEWYENMGFRVITAGVYSIEEINKAEKALDGKKIKSNDPRRKYFSNKRKFEVREICNSLADVAAYYKCETFVMERLKFDNLYNKNRSKGFNKLVNKMWDRTEFVRMIEKNLALKKIKVMKVVAAYSSFVGNLIFRSLGYPDMCLAAFELTRRAFMLKYKCKKTENEDKLVEDVKSSTDEDNNQKRKRKDKGIIFPDMSAFKCFGVKSLEEFSEVIPDRLKSVLADPTGSSYTLYDLYKVLSTSMVRVHLESYKKKFLDSRTFRFCSPKSLVKRIIFEDNDNFVVLKDRQQQNSLGNEGF